MLKQTNKQTVFCNPEMALVPVRYGITPIYMSVRIYFYSLWNMVVRTETDTLDESGTTSLSLTNS